MEACDRDGRPHQADDFSEVFDTFAPAVLRFARRRVGDNDAAWDIVSDTFTAAWRHWHRRPVPASMLPWLYAIAGNAVRDQFRSAGRRTRLAARLWAARRDVVVPDLADGVVLRQSVTAAMARLSEPDQEILRLVGWEQLDDARAVGLALGISPATARVRLHRARQRLRALLAESEEPPTTRPEVAGVEPLPARTDLARLQLARIQPDLEPFPAFTTSAGFQARAKEA
jgi:RNA polymerase sigma factor (sigma-70 family)